MSSNKTTFWVLAATLGLISVALLIPAGLPKNVFLVSTEQKTIPYMGDIAAIWDKMFSRSMQININFADLTNYALVALAGICIIVGIDAAVRRRADRVIKRLFTHTKDKR